jgi:hypothetical protein
VLLKHVADASKRVAGDARDLLGRRAVEANTKAIGELRDLLIRIEERTRRRHE